MEKIKVGIIGMGYIGESHVEAVRRIGLCELYAVADTNTALAQQKAEMYGIPRVYNTVEELLADPAIDAVHNCTPNFLHTEINKKILRAGKHLFSEKPLAISYSQASELAELKKEFPENVAAVNFNYRLNPMVQEMRHRIKNGEIGTVRVVTGQYQQDWLLYDTDYSWRLEPEVAGNSCAIADIGSHWMDMLQHVLDDRIVAVCADLVTVVPTRKKPLRQVETFSSVAPEAYETVSVCNEDYGAVLFRTEKGVSGVFHVSEVAAGHGCYFGIEINGSNGSYGWNQEQNDRLWIGRRDGDNGLAIRNPNTVSSAVRPYTSLAMGHPEGWNDAFKGNIEAFYRYIVSDRKGKPIFSTLEQATYIVKLTEAIVESNRVRGWISVD